MTDYVFQLASISQWMDRRIRAAADARSPGPKPVTWEGPPESDAQSIIVSLKGGTDLSDGSGQSIIGDQVTLPAEIARGHVRAGQAEYLR